jgi:hypothetical protein
MATAVHVNGHAGTHHELACGLLEVAGAPVWHFFLNSETFITCLLKNQQL